MNDMASSLPSVVRNLIRQYSNSGPTYGLCKGYLQANLAILPSKFADAFDQFCQLNDSACPLLYRSKQGEVAAPALASDSDIRTDVLKYWHHKDGKFYEELTDLTRFDWKDMVTFYLGCSFGFEEAVQRAGVILPKIEKNKNVSMYITNVQCNPSPPFSTNMVVSMRPVREDLIEKVFEATYKLECVHGAPVHIGNPSTLGIKDIQSVDFGDPAEIKENEIPVFWACGVTGMKAIQSAALPQCFSHAPGNMFICDVETTVFQESQPSPNTDCSPPRVLKISTKPEVFSVLSDTVKQQLETLEQLLQSDPGNRGIRNLLVSGDFLNSSLRLYQATSVAITTCFPCFTQYAGIQETDGIPGAISIAKALHALGKEVHFIVDRPNEALLNATVKRCVDLGILEETIPVLVYERRQESPDEVAKQFLYPDGCEEKPRFDHLVSIERVGPTRDGTYRNAKGDALDERFIAPIEDLFRQAMADDRIATSSIGDGGNELGMGKVQENVEKFVRNGKVIACNVSSDYLITAGVSNWGGYALAVALYLLSTCPIHSRYTHYGLARVKEKLRSKEDFLNNVKQEEDILKILVGEGVRDGITGKCENSVDGFPFYPHHADQIQQLHDVVMCKELSGTTEQ